MDNNGLEWHSEAICFSGDLSPDIFFPIGKNDQAKEFTKKAKAVCERCPVQYNCLEGALESNEQNGIWGGHTEDERKFIIDEWRDLNSITTNTNEAATQNLYAGIMSIVKIDKAPYKKD